MKMNDFLTKDTTYKSKQAPIFNLNNEQREAQLEATIKDLGTKIGILEQMRVDQDYLEKQLEGQFTVSTEYATTVQILNQQVSDLTMELQDKQRILGVSDGLKQDNVRLVAEHGEAVYSLSNLRMDMVGKEQELSRLRNNTFNLESNNRSMMYATQQKDLLLKELTMALEDLKYQHEGLTSSSNALAQQYADVSRENQKLDSSNLKLHEDLLVSQAQRKSTQDQEKINLVNQKAAIENRIRGESSSKIKELNQDVDTLQRLNAYYKTELSKPQHMSISAIARQEGFKIPLASSSINYRKNNLGTGQATLLRFGNKES